MVGHDQMGVRRDPQRACVDPAPTQRFELLGQHPGSTTTPFPITYSVSLWGTPDGTRRSSNVCRPPTIACPAVVPALEPHDRIGPLGEQVGDLSLPFVARSRRLITIPGIDEGVDARHGRCRAAAVRAARPGSPPAFPGLARLRPRPPRLHPPPEPTPRLRDRPPIPRRSRRARDRRADPAAPSG